MSAIKALAKLKEMMPKTPEVQDAFDTLEEEANKGSDTKGTNDEHMGLELDQSDEDLGGESNPSNDDEYGDSGESHAEGSEEEEAGESPEEEDAEDSDLAKLRKMTGKKKK